MRDTIKIAAAEAARPGITQRLGEFDATATHEPRATPSLIFKEASVVYGKDDERVGGGPRPRRAPGRRGTARCLGAVHPPRGRLDRRAVTSVMWVLELAMRKPHFAYRE